MNIKKASKSILTIAIAAASGLPLNSFADSIEELIVTAQRRAETLQDIPIAVTAFTSEQLNSLSTANLQELTEHIAGTELFDDRGAGQPTWVIRGVGLSDFNSNNTPTAAIYYDEQYLSSNILGGIGMFDIDRVEVLKGPQGGLYGRNTSGGAVRVNSITPELGVDTNGYLSGSYGKWDKRSLEAAVGGTISSKVAYRIAAMTDQGGGWQDSLVTPQDDNYGDRDFTAVRAQLLIEPSDSTRILVKLEGGEDKSETVLGLAKPLYDLSTDFCASAYAGKTDSNNCVTLGNLTNLYALTGDLGTLPSQQDEDGSVVLSNPINALDNSWHGININVETDLGFATLTSITAYLDYENKQVYDFDGTDLALFHEDGVSELTSLSQEFRLISNDDSDIYWLAGAMIARDEIDESRDGDLSDNLFVLPITNTRSFEQNADSWAIYGQVDITLSDSFKLNTSLRYTEEDKELRNASHFDITDQFYFVQGVDLDYELESNWSGHIGLDWIINPDAMVYGKVTRGFKSGGFFGGFPLEVGELEPYDEEIVHSLEFGFKTDWMNQTLRANGAVFYYDYQDVQGYTQTISALTNTPLTKLGNLGDAEHKGAEVDITWLPQQVDGLRLQLGVAWLDADIAESETIVLDPAGVPGELEGLERNFSPDLSTSLMVTYEKSLSDKLIGGIQFSYSWRDDISPRDTFRTDLDYAAFGHESYELLNTRITLENADGSWQLALVGKNLTDEIYSARETGDDLGSYMSIPTRQRSWAIEATYSWE